MRTTRIIRIQISGCKEYRYKKKHLFQTCIFLAGEYNAILNEVNFVYDGNLITSHLEFFSY